MGGARGVSEGEGRGGVRRKGGIRDDDRGLRREVKKDGERRGGEEEGVVRGVGWWREGEGSGGGEKVMTRARECAGRRGEGRVSRETRRWCVCGPADCVIMQQQHWMELFFFFFPPDGAVVPAL